MCHFTSSVALMVLCICCVPRPCSSLVVSVLLVCGTELLEFLFSKPLCYIARVLVYIWILSLLFQCPTSTARDKDLVISFALLLSVSTEKMENVHCRITILKLKRAKALKTMNTAMTSNAGDVIHNIMYL